MSGKCTCSMMAVKKESHLGRVNAISEDCHQEGVTDGRKCDSPKRSVKGIREVSQLTERYDCYEGGVRRCGEVCQLSGSVTVQRRFVS